MRIGIDIDDTISDTYEVLFNYAQDYTANILNREPIIKNIDDCNTHSYTKILYGWTDEQTKEFWELYYKDMIKKVKPKTLSLKYLQKLHEEKNEIILITARYQPEDNSIDIESETRKWLDENFIPYDKLIINAKEKDKIAESEKIDIFIDDCFMNCQAVSKIGIRAYIMDTRMNRNINSEEIERVYSWPHMYMKLKNIIGEETK